MNLLEHLMRVNLPLPDVRPIREWAHDHINFGNLTAFKGRYDVRNVAWTDRILIEWKRPKTRKCTIVMPPQESGKTKAVEVCMCWQVKNRPAPMAFNTKTNAGADKFSDTRWSAMLQACPSLSEKLSPDRHDTKKSRIVWKDGTFLLIQGAESKANRQSDSVEIQINDEVHLWETPWLSEMQSRTLSYAAIGTHKIFNISTGGRKGSEFHQDYKEGNQLEWSHHCPACDGLFQYVHDLRKPERSNIHFDRETVKVDADGTFDFSEFDKTVYVSCPHCDHRMTYDAHRLARMNADALDRGDGYVAMNPNADPSVVSMHCNAYAIGRQPWAKLLHGFIKATIGRRVFAASLLEEYVVKVLAEFWEDQPIIVKKGINYGDYTRAEMAKPGAWTDEWFRGMFVDNQRGKAGDVEHRWFTAVAFSRSGEMRLIDCGRINAWESLREKQIALGIPDSTTERPGPYVLVDRRYKPAEVDEICARYRWFGAQGDKASEFVHGVNSDFPGLRMYFSEARRIDIGYGTSEDRGFAIYYQWSSNAVQDVFASLRLMDGMFTVPRDINEFCPEYGEQINSHQQEIDEESQSRKMKWERIGGTPDHLYDCMCMGTVVGLMAGVFKK